MCATIIVNPADVLKTRFQLQQASAGGAPYTSLISGLRQIFRHEGLRGLQRGLGAASLLQFSNVSARFGFYDVFRKAVVVTGEDPKVAHLKSMGVGAASGLIAAVVSNPFFLLKTRFQAAGTAATGAGHQHSYTSITGAVVDIWRQEGFKGYFKGLPAFAARVMVASSVQLSTYDSVKGALVKTGLDARRTGTHLAASLITGMCVVAAMQPFDYACTRMMNEPPGGRYANVADVIFLTLRERPLVLYSGVLANYARFGPYCCLVFLFLEEFRRLSALVLEPEAPSLAVLATPPKSQRA